MSHTVRTTAKTALAVLVVVLAAAGLLLHADVPQVPSNFWVAAGDMTSVRAGASGTLLPDGLVLVAGGVDANGATASVERFSPDGAHFLEALPMPLPRANHTATLLADGRVLVAGGTGASGTADATAEIYDPSGPVWLPAGSLNVARRGHTATRLADGKVLIAGGDDNGVAIESLEVFDPATTLFTVVDGASGGARTLHAAAALLDGRVLIAGGFDGTNPLGSTSIYDPESNTVSAGPDLSTPRSGLTATTLLDGRVLVAGGAGASGELASAQIFDPATNAFMSTDNTLSSARQNHLAFLLPHNNQVLIVGGLAGGNPVAAAEYFTPWEGTNGTFCAQAICASGYVGPMAPATARAWATGSALSFPADKTIRTGPNDGLLVLAGGSGQQSSELFGFATVKTDKDDYAPGETVTITGSGWQPGEWVALMLKESPLLDSHALEDVQARPDGTIESQEFAPDELDLNIRFYLTAYGSASQAQTTFTDARSLDLTFAGAGGGSVTLTPSTGTVNAPVACGGTGTDASAQTVTSTCSPKISFSDNGAIVTFSASASTGSLFAGWSASLNLTSSTCSGTTNPCSAQLGGNANLTVTFNAKANQTITVTTAAPPSAIYGNSFPVAATASSGLAVGITATGSCSGTGSSSATITMTSGTGSCVVHYNQAGNGSFNAATEVTSSTTAVKATPTLSVTNSPVTYNGSQQAAVVTGSVPGTVSNIKYNGSGTTPTNANTYAITADFAPTDTTNYNSLTTASGGNFIIQKATPTLSVTNSPVTYNGSPQAAVVTGSVAGTVSNIEYNGSSTTPSNAATYAITADFAPTDTTNYNSLTTASAGNFVIQKATPTLSVTNSPLTFNGLPQAATVVGSVPGVVSNIQYNGSGTTPTNAATYAVTADFAPTDTSNYSSLTNASAGNFVIQKATPTLSVTNSPVTFNGSPQGVTVVGSVSGVVSNIQYNGSGTTPTNAATYAVTADFAPTDTSNYTSLPNASAGNFVIQKATPTLSVTNSPVTYSESPQAANVSAGSVPGTVGNIQYNGSSTTPTNAATYTVTADFAPTDTTNYNALTGASAGNFVIQKATPTLSVTNSPVTYSGSPQAATVAGSVPGLESNIQYNGSGTTPTNAATYAVTVDFAPTDTTNYNALIGASAGNFVIQKATPTLSVTNSPVTYNASPQTATVSGSVPGVVSNVLYNGSGTVPTNAATYAITADFAPTDTTNYNALTGASAGNFVIQKATPSLSVTNSPVTYNASPQAANVTGTVPGVVSNIHYNGSGTTPTNAATYAVTADFAPTDSTNYNSLTGASAGNFVIQKATPTLSVTNSPVTYNASPQAAVVVTSVTGVITNVKYNGSGTTPTNANTYAITADFLPTDTTNYNSLTNASAGNFVILKATPTLSVTNSPMTYNGSPQSATVVGSVSGVVSNVLYNGSGTVPTNAATYAITADFAPTDTTNYNALTGAAAGNFVIQKATPTLSVTNSPVTFNGSPQAATVVGSVPGVVSNIQYNGSGTTPTNAATYAVTADFAPTDTTNYNSLTDASAGNFVIQKATPTLSVTNSPVTFNGSPQAATVVGSVPGVVSNTQYNGSGTTPTNAATYAVTADFAPTDTTNYNALTGASAGNFVIQKATPTLSVTNSPVTYSGSPQAAVITGSVSGTVGNIKYNGSGTTPTNAATYAITADFAPTDTTNYSSLTNASAGNFVIQKATPTLSVTNSPVTYNGSPQAAVVTGSVVGAVTNIQYNGSGTTPTNAATYVVTADFAPTDTTNYNSLTGATAGNFVIQKATPTVSVTNSPVTYNGSPQAAAVAGSVAGSVSNIKYNGSAVTPTNAATYAITADFVPSDTTNYNSLTTAATGNFVINRATPTVSVTGGTFVFDSNPHAATGFAYGVGGVLDVLAPALTFSYQGTGSTIYGPSATAPTAVGSYQATGSFAGNPNYLPGSNASALTIGTWTEQGYFQPVDMTTGSSIIWNTIKGGSTVPLKFRIFAGGVEKTNVSAVSNFQVLEVACGAGFDAPIDAFDLSTTGGTSLRYDTNQFIQNWQTPKGANHCYRAVMTAQDGSKIDLAFFKTK